jgi:hypothetical protein
MARWWEIEAAINDALQNVNYARQAAVDFLAYDTADADQDPAMMEFIGNLDRLSAQFKTVFPEDIKRAIKEEGEADDEAEALADAISY